ncbi:aminodeoxychorismate synthase, component I [soil metagenome]
MIDAIQARRDLPWKSPRDVAAAVAMRDGALCLLSDPRIRGSRSFVAADPDRTIVLDRVEGALFEALRQPGWSRGVVGLAAYDAGARSATGPREAVWPDLMLARYPAMLVFDHDSSRLTAVGRGIDRAAAEAACDLAARWLDQAEAPLAGPPPAEAMVSDMTPDAYRAAVSDVVRRIAAGDLFQANVAQGWSGQLEAGTDPFDVFVRLTEQGGAPFGAFWRLGGRAIVSNSPELFVVCERATQRVETRPIKGTRPRGSDAIEDAAQISDLLASAKDRAENLMIVDLMRNDLARVCVPGSVRVERLFEIETFATVHHLVSTVVGTLAPGTGPADVLEAAFPPGSITGAPKHQAMKVIAQLEPPRGPWCGSLFLLDDLGDLTASVLIRTVSFQRTNEAWRFRAPAGAGIVADSDPEAERLETEAKISALRQALTGRPSTAAG